MQRKRESEPFLDEVPLRFCSAPGSHRALLAYMTDSSSSLGSDGRTGRRAKRSGKQKVSSFADEVPNFIDEVIPGTEPVQTIRYVRF